MYRIMLLEKEKDNFKSLYRFLTEVVDDEIKIVEFSTDAELDIFVEDMLNNKGYSKSDFIIVSIKDYDIDANISE